MTSADLTERLRAARPVAPDTLRERVRAIAADRPAPAPSRFSGFRLPRLRLVVPIAAATAVAAAALIAVVRPEPQQDLRQAARPESTPDATTAATAPGSSHGDAPPTGTTATDQSRTMKALPAGSLSGTAPAPTGGRAQDYQAQIGLQVKDNAALSSATKSAMAIARSLGGYVVAAQYASSETGTASLTLRVPSARVQDAIVQLTSLGTITSQQVQIQDLQEQLDQLTRQTTVLRGRIAHITALLADPDLTAERRAELTARRAQLQTELRRIRQQSTVVTQQAAMATIQLSLATKEQSAVPAPVSRVRRTLDQAGQILAWEGVAVLYALVVVLPFAIVAALAWFGARARRRGEEQRLLARTP